MTEIWTRGIATLAAEIAAGELSAREVCQTFLDRAQRLDAELRCFAMIDAPAVLAAADEADARQAAGKTLGPLHGVPLGLKDICDLAGYVTGNGSWISEHDAPAVEDCAVAARLKAAGAIILGKTETHEFAIGGPDPALPTGPALNPWNAAHYAGGSSSGSGAAVAAGAVPGAIGTDTGGSVRIPSAYCGLAGMKPTYGLVSRTGISPLAWALDHPGPMTWTMRDNALMLSALAGYDPRDPVSVRAPVADYLAALDAGVAGLRIAVLDGWHGDLADLVDPQVIGAVEAAAGALVAAGAERVSVDLSTIRDYIACNRVILLAEGYAVHEADFRTRPERFGPFLRGRLLAGSLLSAADYIQALRRRAELVAEIAQAFATADLLLFLAGPSAAPAVADLSPSTFFEGVSVTSPFNVTGNPVLSAPLGADAAGLPLSVQIVAPPYREARAYRAGAVIEAALGDRDIRPPAALHAARAA